MGKAGPEGGEAGGGREVCFILPLGMSVMLPSSYRDASALRTEAVMA